MVAIAPWAQGHRHLHPLSGPREREGCLQPRLVGKWKTCTMGVPTWLSVGCLVLAPHKIERGCETIKQAVKKLCDLAIVRELDHVQTTHLHTRGSATMRKGWKAAVAGTVHDKMAQWRYVGVGDEQLRCKINHQNRIYEPWQGRTTDFKFEIIYNNQEKGHTTMRWVQDECKMNDKQLEECFWF